MNTWEFALLDWIQANLRAPLMDTAMLTVTRLGDKGLIWLALAAVLTARRSTRRQGLAMLLGLALELACCNLVLKPFVARARPCDINTAIQLLIARPADYSFPSGHTGASFAAVSALYLTRWRGWGAAAALAVLIAFSRLYLYVHFPTDVLAGAMLGAVLGGAGALISGRLIAKFSRSRKEPS